MKTKAAVLVCVCAVTALAGKAVADAIPYPASGTVNPTVYTFTAVNTGKVTAYFVNDTAAYSNDLGLLINGVDTGVYGLNNKTSVLGDTLQWDVTAGDALIFVLRCNTLNGALVYSDPSLNAPFDSYYGPSPAFNHVYSTGYTATNPIFGNIPAGTFVAFEDLPATSPSNWNYDDLNFVFTNVSSVVPLPAAAWTGFVLLAGMAGVGLIRRKSV